MTFKATAAALAAVGLASGCSLSSQAALEQNAIATAEARQRLAAIEAVGVDTLRNNERRRAQQLVDRPWIAGRAVPLSREVTLPPNMRRNVALMFPTADMDVSSFAAAVTTATGIPVRVAPEAQLPQSMFAARLGAEDARGPQAATDAVAYGPGDRMPTPEGEFPLPQVLDMMASRLGVFWKYDSALGRIEIFRTETRTFYVKALSAPVSTEMALGRTGGGSSSSGYQDTGNTSVKMDAANSMTAVIQKLSTFLTKSARVSALPGGTSSVVITDTPEALDKVALFIERENKALTRRVRLLFEEVEVETSTSYSQGIDWNLVLAASTRIGLSTLSPSTLVPGSAGTILGVKANSGRWAGSSSAVQALAQQGRIVNYRDTMMQTTNRQPSTKTVGRRFSYVDEVQSNNVSNVNGSSSSPSISQKEESVGTFITVIPDAHDDGQVMLTVSYNVLADMPLQTLRFGEDDQLLVQQIDIKNRGLIQTVELRQGQPFIIGSMNSGNDEANGRRLDDRASIMFGGSNTSSNTKTTQVLIVTVQVDEGV